MTKDNIEIQLMIDNYDIIAFIIHTVRFIE